MDNSVFMPREKDKVVKIKAKTGIVNALDRFYATPMMDAEREGHKECFQELSNWIDVLKVELQAVEDSADAPTADDKLLQELEDELA